MLNPVTIADIFRAEFKVMTEDDLEGFAGVEGNGFQAEIKGCTVILDEANDEGGEGTSFVQVHHIDEDGEFSCWSMELPEFEQIV